MVNRGNVVESLLFSFALKSSESGWSYANTHFRGNMKGRFQKNVAFYQNVKLALEKECLVHKCVKVAIKGVVFHRVKKRS